MLATATPFVASRFGGFRRFFYCLFVLSLQLAVGVNVIYRAELKRAGANGVRITPTLLLGAALIILSMFDPVDVRCRPVISRRSWLWASGAFLMTSTLSVINTPVKMWTAFGLVEIGSLIGIGTIARSFGSSREAIQTTRSVFIASLFTQSCILLIQNVTGVGFSLTDSSLAAASRAAILNQQTWMTTWFTGTMVTPSESATFLVVCLMVALGTLFSPYHQGK